MDDLFLRELTRADQSTLLSAIEEFKAEPEFSFAHCFNEGISIDEYCERLDRLKKGTYDPAYVPSTFLFAFVGEKIVGRVSIRHRLDAVLEKVGGHIGYAVVPSERKKGVATQILAQSLVIAKSLGLKKVLLTCDEDNIGSVRTIEKNGGILEGLYSVPEASKVKRRFWIEVT